MYMVNSTKRRPAGDYTASRSSSGRLSANDNHTSSGSNADDGSVDSGDMMPGDEVLKVWEYVEVGGSNRTFVGCEELHMTAHHCVGVLLESKTCVFRNLYYNGNQTVQVRGRHAVWEYYTSVPAEASDEAAQAHAAAVNKSSYVYQHPYASHGERFAASWDLRVVVFRRTAAAVSVAVVPAAVAMPSAGSIAWPGATAPTGIADRVMAHPNGSTVYDEKQAASFWGACSAVTPLPVNCTPPWVAAAWGVPAGLIIRGVHWNIGHTMFDEHVPWFTAVHDLGLGEHIAEFVPLYTNIPEEMGKRWDGNGLTRQTYRGLSPNYHPVLYFEFSEAVGDASVLFRTVVTGLCGRSAHSIQRDYSVPGVEYRSMWLWRNYYIHNLGLAHTDNDWRTLPPTAPLKVIMLQKPDKRRIRNMYELVEHLRSEFGPSGVEFMVMDWADLGRHVHEVALAQQTHILVGVDGTGMMGAFLLPPGSVYISIPTAGRHGYPTQLGDFMINGNDHIRVLYYDGLQAGDYSPHQLQSDLTVNSTRLLPYMREAVRLLRDQFPIPVPFLTNHSPAARMYCRLLNVFPDILLRMSFAWLDNGGSPVADRLRHNPDDFWRDSVKVDPVSPLLPDIVAGRIGNPPTWEGP